MTPLAPQADQAVRHAVDAYIDGRLLPVFEGQGAFETRNSAYRLLDGVVLSGPNHDVVGAELVGWLVEFVARAEVSQSWRTGARAVLVDTRNDGVRGPHIVVTSATRAFRIDRPSERPSKPGVGAGSRAIHSGSGEAQLWKHRSDLPPLPPIPAPMHGATRPQVETGQRLALDPGRLPAPAPIPFTSARPATVPPPPMVPARLPQTIAPPPMVAPSMERAHPATLPPPPPMVTARPGTLPPPPMVSARHAEYLPPPPPMVSARPGTMPPPPPPRMLPRALPPPPPAYDDGFVARRIAATLDAALMVADDLDDAAPTARNSPASDWRSASRSASRLSHGAAIAGRNTSASAYDARQSLPRDHRQSLPRSGRDLMPPPPASIPFLLSKAHQRGLPLR